MADNNRPVQSSRDPFDRFDEAISDPRLYETGQSRYEQLRYEPEPQMQPRYEQEYESRYAQPFALSFDRSETLRKPALAHTS